MSVELVKVSYLREKQPKDYEKVAPAVEFSAGVDDGEDHTEVARKLMLDAATLVHAGMGIGLPASIAKKLGGEVTKEESPKKAQTAPKQEEKPKEETRQVTENPEDRKNPEDVPSDPEPEPAKEAPMATMPAGMDHAGLHQYMIDLVTGKAASNGKKVSGEVAKELFTSEGIERVSDLPEEKIPDLWQKLYKLQVEAEKS